MGSQILVLFDPDEYAAWGGLLSTYAQMDRAVDVDLRERDGITHTEFEVLLRLRYAPEGRMRIQELAERSILTRSGTSRLVNRLELAGLIAREEVPGDGRGTYALLTPAGETLFDAAAARHIAFVREHFHARLDADDIAALGRIWAKLAR